MYLFTWKIEKLKKFEAKTQSPRANPTQVDRLIYNQ